MMKRSLQAGTRMPPYGADYHRTPTKNFFKCLLPEECKLGNNEIRFVLGEIENCRGGITIPLLCWLR